MGRWGRRCVGAAVEAGCGGGCGVGTVILMDDGQEVGALALVGVAVGNRRIGRCGSASMGWSGVRGASGWS